MRAPLRVAPVVGVAQAEKVYKVPVAEPERRYRKEKPYPLLAANAPRPVLGRGPAPRVKERELPVVPSPPRELLKRPQA